MWGKFCGWLLRKYGWTSIGGRCDDPKAILVGAPHTSLWDVVVSYMYYRQYGKGVPHTMIKKEFFFPPMSWILRAIGAFPVDRSSPTATVKSAIDTMNSSKKQFLMAIAVEGTRKPVHKWKTGYHLIAKETGAPVYLCIFDWGHKRIGIVEKFELTDNARADTDRLQARYKELGVIGKHPEKFVTE